MKILVTGGGGYIGSVLVGHLLRAGCGVTVLDNLWHRTHGLFQYCSHKGFEFVRGDARDEAVLSKLVPGADFILPLAAVVGMPACDRDPIMASTTNFEAIALLNRLRSKDQPVIFPCTNSGYGTKSGSVFCTEESPLEPISVYGRTKVDAEKLLLDSPNTLSFRLATVFGVSARMRLDLLVNDFVHRAVTDRFLVLYEEHFKRNYLHIEDVAQVFLFAIENFEKLKGEPYNVGLGEANLSKRELAEKVKQYVPNLCIHSAEIGSDPDKRNYVISNAKLEARGFTAKHTLDLGIQQLLTAFRMLPGGILSNAA